MEIYWSLTFTPYLDIIESISFWKENGGAWNSNELSLFLVDKLS